MQSKHCKQAGCSLSFSANFASRSNIKPMTYNFDEVPGRENSNCLKWDKREEVFGRSDVIPMWIADMDFSTPPFIIEALRERLNHGILGYSYRPDAYFNSFIRWASDLYGWDIRREWIEFSPGVTGSKNSRLPSRKAGCFADKVGLTVWTTSGSAPSCEGRPGTPAASCAGRTSRPAASRPRTSAPRGCARRRG